MNYHQIFVITAVRVFSVFMLFAAIIPNAISQTDIREVPSLLVNYPDKIFMNTTIVTLDEHELNSNPGSIVKAMAVRDEVIIALGTEDEMLALAGPKTEIIDLGGKMMLPAIVESHVHPMGNSESFAREKFGLRATPTGYDLRMDAASNSDETMAKVARAMALLLNTVEPGPDDWISISLDESPPDAPSVSTLIAPRRMADVRISKEDITEIVPNYPFILTSGNQIFGKTGYGATPEQSAEAPKEKNIWYHVTADEHGEPVSVPVVEFRD